MHSLVTGGAGFIGSHLVDALLAAGHRVTVLDDLSTGSRANLAHHTQELALSFVRGTILDAGLVEALVEQVDFVFHLAAAVGVHQIVAAPVRAIVTNTSGSHNVLEACARHQRPVLLTSTSEVYGRSEREYFSEEDDLILGAPTRARWCYAASKALDEYLALAYHHERALPVRVVRLFNTVGPRQTGRYGMVVPRLVGQALAGEPLTVYGDGEQTRVFAHIADIVPALVELSRRDDLAGEILNLGGVHELSINQLARRILELTGRPGARIRMVSYDDAYDAGFEDMRRRRPDISKAGRLIDFKPKRGIDDIIRDVAAYISHDRR